MAVYPATAEKPVPFTTPKHPDDVVVYKFQFGNDLGDSETLSTHTVTPATGLTKDTSIISGTDVLATLSGGTADRNYTVECQVTTSASRTLTMTGVVKVRNR